MIHIKQISPIATILLDAAKARRTATYTAIYRAFGKEVPNKDVFDTVEAAARALSYSTFAIYSAVLAKKDTGLPGSGFFDIYRIAFICRPAQTCLIRNVCWRQINLVGLNLRRAEPMGIVRF